ncbi:hypothetical protein BpHYR1_029443 [Brachionus plicatilis]|uniref:Uncharacterized protein n=1 Tax=Brachionus plicatilis TaxID=10195 RepID=A0A3M7QSJ9_BRAPC|nr:hypothetical protein BpHYR1_029443 [Brachionus plicatilis]
MSNLSHFCNSWLKENIKSNHNKLRFHTNLYVLDLKKLCFEFLKNYCNLLHIKKFIYTWKSGLGLDLRLTFWFDSIILFIEKVLNEY